MGDSADTKETKEPNHQDKRINEIDAGGPKRIPLENYNESSKAVCKIILERIKLNATGFFFQDSQKNYFLITNYHVISPKILEENPIISVEIYNKKLLEINLKEYQKHIQFFEAPLDITLIEINDLKELNRHVKFLEVDLNYKKGYQVYLNNDVFALGYPLGNKVECSLWKITEIKNNEFKHNCNIAKGSSGSPIILAYNSNLIGIHKAGIGNENINIGIFIGKILIRKRNLTNGVENDSQDVYNINWKNKRTPSKKKCVSIKKKEKKKYYNSIVAIFELISLKHYKI